MILIPSVSSKLSALHCVQLSESNGKAYVSYVPKVDSHVYSAVSKNTLDDEILY
jgi:hypothetical protein